MSTRTLGLLGILGSPFLAIQLSMSGIFENSVPTSLGGIFGLIYMTGWFCSILGLYKLNAAGNKKGGTILIIQMVLLTVGNLWNVYSIINPTCNTMLYNITDAIGWPFDNLFMLATGIAIVSAKQLHGWKRFVPLFVGLWFPVTLVLTRLIFGSSNAELFITSLYSIIGWSLLGLVVYTSSCKDMRSDILYPASS
ncbi:MAG TPA: hypothetical protein VEV83_20115 [Parafilimonas sp.]|nr:hypothetical protein [Parafilimonas sp.]